MKKYLFGLLLIAVQTAYAADTTAPVIYAAHVHDITSTTASISWSTDEPTTGSLEYSTDSGFGTYAILTTAGSARDHTVNLTGLANNSVYYYRVRASDAAGNANVTNPLQTVAGAANAIAAPDFFSFQARNTRAWVVSTAGNDSSGDGTVGAPLATCGAAISQVQRGDTIQFRGGQTHTCASTISVSNVTFTTYPGDFTPLADGVRGAPAGVATIYSDPLVTTPGFNIRTDIDAHGVWFHDLIMSGGGYYAIKTESNWTYGGGLTRRGSSNLLIENVEIHDSGRDAIKFVPGSDHGTVRNSIIHDTGVRDPSNADGIDCVNCDYLTVVNNHFYDIATSGLYPKGGAIGALVERNLIERCGSVGIAVGFYSDGDWFDTTQNPNYHENIDGVARNNIVTDCAYAGIGIYGALRPRVYNNTLINNGSAGRASVTIIHGLIYYYADIYRPLVVDAQVHNNIIWPNPANPAIEIVNGDVWSISGTTQINYNRYHQATGTPLFDHGQSSPNGNFTAWQALGYDANSTVGDPQIGVSDWVPDTGSPVIGAGLLIEAMHRDYLDALRSAPYDIGAIEKTFLAPLKRPSNINIAIQ